MAIELKTDQWSITTDKSLLPDMEGAEAMTKPCRQDEEDYED